MTIKIWEGKGKSEKTAIWRQSCIERTLYVAIDVAKYYHKALIFDLNKRVLEDSFSFDSTQKGFKFLVDRIENQAKKQKAKSIVVGLEATAHYHESLVEHLKARNYRVILLNPYATFKTRALNIDYVKTDEIDLKAILEAMLLNKGREIIDEPEIYRRLKLLTRFRRAKNEARKVLKVQMLRDLDRLWPGLLKSSKVKTGLFSNLWESKVAQALFKLNLLPQQIARLKPLELIERCKSLRCNGVGYSWARKIITHASQALPCREEEALVHQQVFKINLKLLKELDELIADLDREIALLLNRTPGVYLLSIQGISTITAAEFLGEIGDPAKYSSPGEWVKLAGLNASRYQSGLADRKENPITKVGNKFLRSTVFTIARNISRWEPLFIKHRDKFLSRGRPIGVAYGAVGNKFLRVAFKILTQKVNFDPDYETKGGRGLTQNN